MREISKFNKRVYLFFTGITFAIIIYFVLYKLGAIKISFSNKPCMAVKYLHLYCAACGGTRSIRALCDFNVLHAIKCNIWVVYSCVFYLVFYIKSTLYYFSGKDSKLFKIKLSYIVIWIIIAITNVVLKNILVVFFSCDYLGDILKYWT